MLHDRLLTATTKDAVLLARLAWVLQRVNEHERAAALLDRAAAMKPTDPAIRKQLFGALVTAGRLTQGLDGREGSEGRRGGRGGGRGRGAVHVGEGGSR